MSAVMSEQMNLLDEHEAQWQAVLEKNSAFDGQFVYAVSSTRIYCRPSCASRRPRRDRVSFFQLPALAEQSGFRACLRCKPRETSGHDPQTQMAQQVCRIIEQNDGESITLAELSKRVGVSSFHLQRTFKGLMGITPKDYAAAQRVKKFKREVRGGEAITSAMYDAGFGSSSRLYETAATQLGMTPATYSKGGRGVVINFATTTTSLGHLLVAATSKGVCSVMLGDSEAELESDLRREFPAAEIHDDEKPLRASLNAIVEHLQNKNPRVELPLDIRATAFQRQVWEQLSAIPYGETYSYSEVAKAIGQEKAVRAVARACATNPVALVIPCHRVIREDKSLGGYRWGIERKKKLLAAEKSAASKP